MITRIVIACVVVVVVALESTVMADYEVGSPNCDTYTACTTCTSAKTWTGSSCRWCPKTANCHAEGSLSNKCNSEEQITSPDNCGPELDGKPSQVHIALNGESGRIVSWATKKATNESVVRYGLSPTALNQEARGQEKDQTLLENVYHHVFIENLKPSTTYYYICGDASEGWSEVYRFATHDFETPGSFVASVFGDWGYGENGNAVKTKVSLEKMVDSFDFVWHLGDIAYADDAFLHDITGFEYENIYDAWFNWIEANISSSTPYMVVPGNHESECHSVACIASSTYRNALKNFSAYNTRWKMPYAASGSPSNMWYSFDFGLAHFISIDTETDFPSAPEETKGDSGLLPAGGFGRSGEYLQWLENDLREANASRSVRPWIFAGGHRQLYDVDGSVNKPLQDAVEDLFHTYGVDVYFAGHQHYYTRSFPVYKSVVESKDYNSPESTAYVVVGGAGCDEMKIDDDQSASTIEDGKSSWTAYTDKSHYGTGLLRVHNRTHVTWEYILSDDQSVADTFTIAKAI